MKKNLFSTSSEGVQLMKRLGYIYLIVQLIPRENFRLTTCMVTRAAILRNIRSSEAIKAPLNIKGQLSGAKPVDEAPRRAHSHVVYDVAIAGETRKAL